MMSWRWQKVGLLLGWLVIGGLGGCSLGKSEEKIAKKAKEFTVIIDGCGAGSGAIFKREGNTYSVLTAYHVVDKSWTCLIFTSDQESYQVRGNTITQPVPEVDLGVLTFTSDKSYPVAKLGDSEKMVEATSVLVVGAPGIIGRIKTRTLLFNWGKIIGRVPQPKDGYSLIYDANTEPGMSGGPVLNNRGEIVGVHGQGDRDENNIKTGWNLGIPIQIFLKGEKNDDDYIGRLITRINWQNIAMLLITIAIGGIIFVIVVLVFVWIYIIIYTIIHYNRRVEYKKPEFNSAAISTKSIKTDNKSAADYYNQGVTNSNLKKDDLALPDYKKDIEQKTDNKSAVDYYNQGLRNYNLKKYDLAIADYTKAIALDPNLAAAYNNRGTAYYDLKKYDLAIADYNKAIALDQNYAAAYNNRGLAYYDLKKYDLAIADYNKAIALDPNYAAAYFGRGWTYYNLKDYDLAIADYNKAISLDQNYAAAYNNRGNAYYDLKKYDLAIADYNKAIALDQNYAHPYYSLGLIAETTGDIQTAIKNYEKAAALYQQQGDDIWYQNAMSNLKRLKGY